MENTENAIKEIKILAGKFIAISIKNPRDIQLLEIDMKKHEMLFNIKDSEQREILEKLFWKIVNSSKAKIE